MKKSKIITGFTAFLIISMAALSMFAMTSLLQNKVAKEDMNYTALFLDYEILPKFYYSLADRVDDNDDGLLNYVEVNQPIDEEVTAQVEQYQEEWNFEVDGESEFQYYVYSNKSKKADFNETSQLANISEDPKIQNKYDWYLCVDFDQDGKMKVKTNDKDDNLAIKNQQSLEEQMERFINHYSLSFSIDDVNEDTGEYIGTKEYRVKFKPIQDTRFVFAVKESKEFSYGFIDEYMDYQQGNVVERGLLPITILLSGIIAIIALLIPIRYLHQISLLKHIARIKFEILIPVLCLSAFSTALIGLEISRSIVYGILPSFLNSYQLMEIEPICRFLFAFVPWFIYYLIIFFIAYYIKLIFEKGFIRYFKENSLVAWGKSAIKRLIGKVVQFDLQDPTNKAILKIVGVNFLIITGISFLFVFGFFFTLLYSFVLFMILRQKFDEIKKDYNVLVNATKKLSNGDFDVEIKEDLGMFNSLRDEFTNIRDGFEKAVNEDVKSQKMKTELVSNVSHDLKTPLTSIITYTDLLKDENISEQQRKEYIETLERNSLRLKNIIEDLFEMSKANSGNVILNLVDVDVVSLVKQAQFECLELFEKRSLSFHLNASSDKIIHSLDSSKTYRVFENLFTNIAKYAMPKTRVYVDVIEKTNAVEIVFKNISENALHLEGEELVERFVQGDSSRNSEGSGLGLAIAKSFSELQNGTFKVEVDGDLFKVIVSFKK